MYTRLYTFRGSCFSVESWNNSFMPSYDQLALLFHSSSSPIETGGLGGQMVVWQQGKGAAVMPPLLRRMLV